MVQLAVKLTVLMGNTNEAERNVFKSEEVSITEGEILNTDEESNLEKKVELGGVPSS